MSGSPGPVGVVLPPIRLIGGWALAVIAVVATVVTARAIEWALAVRNYRLRIDYDNGVLGATEYMNRLGSTQSWLWASSVAILAQLVATALFIVWLYLARSNAESLSAAQHRLSRGWALACFLPVVDWFLPPIVLDDIQRAAHPAAPRDPRRLPATSTTVLVVLWWMSFVLGSSLAFGSYLFGFASRTGAATASRAGAGVVIGLAGITLLITAAVLLAVIMLRVTRWQEQQAAEQLLPDPQSAPVVQPYPQQPLSVPSQLPDTELTFAAPQLPRPQLLPESELAYAAPHLFSAPHTGAFGAPPRTFGSASLSPAGRGLSEVTAIALIAVAAGPAIVALSAPLYPRDSKDESIDYERAIDEWAPIMLLGVGVWAVTLMLAGGVFLYWLWQARANAEILAPEGHSLGRGWVFSGWFVPLVNLVFPAFVVADIHRAGRPGSPSAPWLVGAWWCAWIGAWIASGIGLNALAAPVLWLASLLFAVGAGLLTAIIWQTNSDQTAAASS
ncbi:DUF4328 domain-containing protein [Nocardia sp. NPDC059180]|uniref:DUF4328 domain-containing protein n=1 Tax=Nocardia sp. NPDC059180 TaxID=3346761 RepID=UPI00369AE02D